MKKLIVRVAASALCATLCLTLTGCQSKTTDDPNGVVATIGGRELQTDEFIYYLLPYKQQYLQQDPNYFISDATREDNLFSSLITAISYDNAMFEWAAENGVTLTDADRQLVDSDLKQDVALYGGEEEFKAELAKNNQTERLHRELAEQQILVGKISELIYSESSPLAVSDEEAARYIAENGVLGAKHILILFTDDKESDLARAQDILERLHAGASFDELMNEYSEDTGLANAPNGYTFGPGEMFEPFESGTAALEIGELSGIVETSYGYHIIQRIEPDISSIKQTLMNNKLSEIIAERAADMEIVYCPDFDRITIDDIKFKGDSQ